MLLLSSSPLLLLADSSFCSHIARFLAAAVDYSTRGRPAAVRCGGEVVGAGAARGVSLGFAL
jgi:hypothetical protein